MTLEGPPPTRRDLRARKAPSVEVPTPPVDDASAVPLLVAAAALTADEETTAPASGDPVTASVPTPEPVPVEPAVLPEPADADEQADPEPDTAPVAVAPAQPEPEPAAAPEAVPEPETEVGSAPGSEPVPEEEPEPAAAAEPPVPVVIPPTALSWVDERDVLARTTPQLQLTAQTGGYTPVAADLLARAPRRSPWRPGVLVPLGLILTIVVAYCGTLLAWPLHAVAPTVSAISVQPVAAAPATPAWPAEGIAAVVADGVGPAVASSGDAAPMASITKIVTALLVLEQEPLTPGEQGRSFQFTAADRTAYRGYLSRGESALDVPVGGSLTMYQMLQGMLIGSANNYADRLAQTYWPTDAVFAAAANNWLAQRGITGVRVVEPTGIEPANIGTPEALLALGKRALANPVIAEIVRTQTVELPGAGIVDNTNRLLADPGVVGIKTGTLDAYNLLSAKDITVGETVVRVYADVQGQPDNDTRDAATQALFAQLEQELQPVPSVPVGTTVGQVETRWGDPIAIVTAADASVVLWNGTAATTETVFSLGDARTEGDVVGSLTATGPRDSASVELLLAADVTGPSPWWRLTHPLELFGLV
ncbi:D-alanyl-D-alanine carboxypeptidase family protein [Microbacterium sp. GXF7504]